MTTTHAFASLLAQGTATPEEFVRAFAAEYPTPNVLAALGYCESGRLTFEQVYPICAEALGKAVKEVK